MGSAYAGHLIEAGFPTWGFDVDADAMRRFEQRGGTCARDARALAGDTEVVITALPSAGAVEKAYFGADGLAAGARSGLVVIEASTLPLALKERCRATLSAQGAAVLDAPVSGTGSQARVKDLAIYASGDRAAYDRVRDILTSIARVVRYVGEFAREVGAPTPLFTASAAFYAAALAEGRGKQDTAAIASVLKAMAGLAPDP